MNYIDLIARLGLGSAHPGGYDATIRQLQKYPLPIGSNVLEVGCGTGKTACLLASQGMHVTAVDAHEQMVHLAQERARSLHYAIHIVQADACSLPFPDHSFDVVFIESVTSFLPIDQALSEYARVLRPNGTLYDREIVVLPHPERVLRSDLIHTLGLCAVWSVDEWLHALQQHGFSTTDALEIGVLESTNGTNADEAMPDAGILLDPDLWRISGIYAQAIESIQKTGGYALLRAIK